MADIVNLNRFRKDKERAEKAAKAVENRAAHGRTKASKTADTAREKKAKTKLDQHRLDKDET
ncbi:hypothetical protein IZ6_21280 [Terrihabitans soli]|uniref:DUF4169 family protein n=1 Tax=Terrihabitans soli TaxID=708113 RepID=A0A6S6QJE1_9HYPH|nr:hypothetical protein IZ6_21280 [Terrihabitans soli]